MPPATRRLFGDAGVGDSAGAPGAPGVGGAAGACGASGVGGAAGAGAAAGARDSDRSPDAGGFDCGRRDPAAVAADPHWLARLLEDGDRADLAWLCAATPAAELAAWIELHGARRLSRRSLAFWAVVLERADLRPERLPALARRHELWPL